MSSSSTARRPGIPAPTLQTGHSAFTNPIPTAKKHHNLTFILCDMKSKGITVKGIPYMNGAHVYNEVYLDDVHMPAKYIVGQENEGWAVVNVLAGFERSNIDMVMGLVRGLEELVNFCNENQTRWQAPVTGSDGPQQDCRCCLPA